MIWILLAVLGVPVWFLIGVAAVGLWSRRAFKRAPGVFPAKVRVVTGTVAGLKPSWPRSPMYARWVHDVLLVHHGLALMRNQALPAAGVDGPVVPPDLNQILHLGPSPLVLSLTLDSGATVELAGPPDDSDAVVGPYTGILL